MKEVTFTVTLKFDGDIKEAHINEVSDNILYAIRERKYNEGVAPRNSGIITDYISVGYNGKMIHENKPI